MARTQQRTWVKASKLAKSYDIQTRMIYEHVARTDFPIDAFRTLPSGYLLLDADAYDAWLKQFNVQFRTRCALSVRS